MKSADPFRLAIVDYGMGNLRSVQNAFSRLGSTVEITHDPKKLAAADAFVLPGVGAFGLAMENLHSRNLVDALNEEVLQKKKPMLGICLGMQLFADRGLEIGEHRGLGWIPGQVEKIESLSKNMKVPHVGWNETLPNPQAPLFPRVPAGSHFYFDHSYHYACEDKYVMARVDYGSKLVAAVQKENIYGVQFHPEKSQVAGLRLLRGFLLLAQGRKGQC